MLKIKNEWKSLGLGDCKKEQIILCHTGREANDYLTSLTFRFNMNYVKVPHYLIKRDGGVISLLPTKEVSGIKINSTPRPNAIYIMLENLGWLEKKQLSEAYVNWFEYIYKGEIIQKKWRDYFFWHPYTNEQMAQVKNILNKLFKEEQIEENILGHNTKISGAENYKGVLCRSNFNTIYTDLSPAFNFNLIEKK